MHLILPVSGQSSRFPDLRPKWMLNHPNGNLMLAESFLEWDLSNIDSILVICLRQHEDEYDVTNMMQKQFAKLGLENLIQVIVIDKSDSQPHSVYQGIQAKKLTGPIFVKDSDNYFSHIPESGNTVCYLPLEANNRGNAANKSYIQMNETGAILNIVEKRIISNTFCCGGYGFADASDFLSTFEKLKDTPDLYISHIIYQMILDSQSFYGSEVSNYVDWGTLEDWNAYRSQFRTLFIDIDGVLVQSSAEYYKPFWGETDAIENNVSIINELYDSGYGEVILITSRTEEVAEITRQQLKRINIKYHRILFGLLHAKRIIVNDFSKSNPYPSCEAINISRNSDQLTDVLQGLTEE